LLESLMGFEGGTMG